jgi:hypothetical protein
MRVNRAVGYYPLLGCTRVLNMTTVNSDANKLAHPTFWHKFLLKNVHRGYSRNSKYTVGTKCNVS